MASATQDEARQRAEQLAASLPPQTEEIEQKIAENEVAG
jgi:hypothetical protein